MKAVLSARRIERWLIAVGFVVWGGATAWSQDAVYAARVSSSSTAQWDSPFYWIDYGLNSPYSVSTRQSSATNPVTPTRLGSYYHTANLLSVGEGYGVVHTNGTQAGAVYEVQVTQPSFDVSTDIIMNVGSTNCDVGGVFRADAAGGWTNTTAFQAAYSANQWARVCYLTNRPGVTQPQVDFRYASSVTASLRNYADCVRFHLIGLGTNGPGPVHLATMSGTNLSYSGGWATRFVLLQSANLGGWERVATNYATPGSFSIPAVGTGTAAFYRILSE
jgi:hypothetical protein